MTPLGPFHSLSFSARGMEGATVFSVTLRGLGRFAVRALAIMKDFFSQFVPHRMTRYEVLELSWRLREMAKRMQ